MFDENLKFIDKKTIDLFKKIGKLADDNLVEVYVVGGFVRDIILKRNCVDIDFVVVGSGPEFAKKVSNILKIKNIVVYEKFETAFIPYKEYKLEFVSARSESYNSNSRNPSVVVADLNTDIMRRDFTINAMALSLNNKTFLQLKDPLNGMLDLQNKIIKTPLDPLETFNDDPLRIMRAIRFASQLGFIIEEKTFNAIQKTIYRLSIISMERIRDEFIKIMLTEKPSIGLWHLYNTGILQIIIPELCDLYGVEDILGNRHKNNLSHTFQVVDQICENTQKIELRLSALFHDIGKAKTKKLLPNKGWSFHNHEYVGSKMIREIFYKLKMQKDWSIYVTKLVKLHMRPIALTEEEVTDSAIRRLIVQADNELEDLMILACADITSRNPQKRSQKREKFEFVKKRIQEVNEIDRLRSFQSPVRGEEIMKITGLTPSKKIGLYKKAIEEAILDGIIPNEYEPAKEFLLNLIEQEKNSILNKKNK